MPEIRGLPEVEEKPGQNPLRVAVLRALRGAASDPTALEVGPLGMTRAFRALTAAEKARVEELFKVPLTKGRRPKAVEDEIASLLRIPSRTDIEMMLKKRGIFPW